MKRVGLAQDLPQQSESDDTPVQETASDWSASRMQKFVEQRERESRPQDEPRNRDPSMRRITAGTPLDAYNNPDE
jgi:hypothetical protein